MSDKKHIFSLWQSQLGVRLLVLFMLMAVIPLGISGFLGYRSSVSAINDLARDKITSLIDLKVKNISTLIQFYEQDMKYLATGETTSRAMQGFVDAYQKSGKSLDNFIGSYSWAEVREERAADIKRFISEHAYADMLLIDLDGNVLYSANDGALQGQNLQSDSYRNTRLAKAALQSLDTGQQRFSDFEQLPGQSSVSGFLLWVVIGSYGEKIGLVALPFPYEKLTELIAKQESQLGETFLLGTDKLLRVSSAQADDASMLKQKIDTRVVNVWLDSLKPQASDVGSRNLLHYGNASGEAVVGAFASLTIADKTLGFFNEIPQQIIYQSTQTLTEQVVFTLLVTIVVAMFIVWLLARSISLPLIAGMSDISAATTQIDATMQQQVLNSQNQVGAVNEITASINQLESSARQTSEQAGSVSADTLAGRKLVDQGNAKIKKTADGMQQMREKMQDISRQIEVLSGQTGEISKVAKMVLELANQTKLLALNAAVEAVRAGEQGKGFSVVANEIGALSEESKKSAEKIGKLLMTIHQSMEAAVIITRDGKQSIDEGARLTDDIVDLFGDLAKTFMATSENIEQIVLNVKQESESVGQVFESMSLVNNSQQDNLQEINQAKESISSLQKVVQRIKSMV